MSRVYDALRRAEARRSGSEPDGPVPGEPRGFRVLSVVANKGGVGKTTLATNLAVYLRALDEDLPILVFGLDDQDVLDQMFRLEPEAAGPDIGAALRSGALRDAVQIGQYGIHFIPSSADLEPLKREITDPFRLRNVLLRSGWRGLVIIDTKSDLEILTRNALAASDLTLVAVKDGASLGQAERVFRLLDSLGMPRERARVVLSLIDLRVKYSQGADRDVLALLVAEIRRLGLPLCQSFVSRSPKVEGLHTNPEERVTSVLSGAPGTVVDRQLRQLAQEVKALLDEIPMERMEPVGPAPPRRVDPAPVAEDLRRRLFGRSRNRGRGF